MQVEGDAHAQTVASQESLQNAHTDTETSIHTEQNYMVAHNETPHSHDAITVHQEALDHAALDAHHEASIAGLNELMTFEVHVNEAPILLGDNIDSANAHLDNSWVSSHTGAETATWTDHTETPTIAHNDTTQDTHHDDGTMGNNIAFEPGTTHHAA